MSATLNDGGPAFPGGLNSAKVTRVTVEGGMSLRDFFAGQALVSLIHRREMTNCEAYSRPELASEAYHYADAMIEERNKKQEGN